MEGQLYYRNWTLRNCTGCKEVSVSGIVPKVDTSQLGWKAEWKAAHKVKESEDELEPIRK